MGTKGKGKYTYDEDEKKEKVVEEEKQEKKYEDDISKDENKWWENGKFTSKENSQPMVEKSSFNIMYPQARELYLKSVLPLLEYFFKKELKIEIEIKYDQGLIVVSTTNKTIDPYAIVNGKSIMTLIARGTTFEQAKKVLDPMMSFEIIKIKSYVRNTEVFMNRRQRLIGPKGATLKALQLLTKTDIIVYGKTVCVIGEYHALSEVRKVVEDCMNNVHPIYNIKRLMVKRELQKNPEMKTEDWSKYLPEYRKTVNKTKHKSKRIKEKKKYTPYPNPIEKSKVDLQIESGEYFMSEALKESRSLKQRIEKSKVARVENLKRKVEAIETSNNDGESKSTEGASSSSNIKKKSIVSKKRLEKIKSQFQKKGITKTQKNEIIESLKPKKRKN